MLIVVQQNNCVVQQKTSAMRCWLYAIFCGTNAITDKCYMLTDTAVYHTEIMNYFKVHLPLIVKFLPVTVESSSC